MFERRCWCLSGGVGVWPGCGAFEPCCGGVSIGPCCQVGPLSLAVKVLIGACCQRGAFEPSC